jgi:hypothetical protein
MEWIWADDGNILQKSIETFMKSLDHRIKTSLELLRSNEELALKMNPIINNKVNDMKTEIYKKVYMQSEDDLPKKEGYYFVWLYDDLYADLQCNLEVFRYSDDTTIQEEWILCVEWYLIPVEITDEQIEEMVLDSVLKLTEYESFSPLLAGALIAERQIGIKMLKNKLIKEDENIKD